MSLSDDVRNRLYNFKFEQARRKLSYEERDTAEGELVVQLAERYDNPGWMDGSEGRFIWAVLALLGVTEEG